MVIFAIATLNCKSQTSIPGVTIHPQLTTRLNFFTVNCNMEKPPNYVYLQTINNNGQKVAFMT